MSINNKKKINILFIGTSDFGIPSLGALLNNKDFHVVGVVTQPDKKTGRKQVLTPPPIKIEGAKHKLPIFQPEKIINLIKELKKAEIKNIDLIIVVAYAQLIPENLINLPKYGTINVHGSLLPKYRGSSCVQAAILNGDKETGISIIKIINKLDAGPILSQKKIKIKKNDTAGDVFMELSNLSAPLLVNTVYNIINNKIFPKIQDETKATYVKALKKEDGRINWNLDAKQIINFIRSRLPWPGAFSYLNDKKSLKIIEIEPNFLNIEEYSVGQIMANKNNLIIQCKKNCVIVKKLQVEGKKVINASDFIKGYKKYLETILN